MTKHIRGKRRSEVGFFIHQTDYQYYDVVAIGSLDKLKALKKKCKNFDLIKSSGFGTPILICDTCDTLTEAGCSLEEYKALYGTK
jgi:hypothetical protein